MARVPSGPTVVRGATEPPEEFRVRVAEAEASERRARAAAPTEAMDVVILPRRPRWQVGVIIAVGAALFGALLYLLPW